MNRRVPVGTHGGVRGRLSIRESLLLDYTEFMKKQAEAFASACALTKVTRLSNKYKVMEGTEDV